MDNKKIVGAVLGVSGLLVGATLALVMLIVALMFLSAGYPLSGNLMWLVILGGLVVWLSGSFPVARLVNNLYYFGGVVFVVMMFWNFVATSTNSSQYYSTIFYPFAILVLIGGTLISVLVKMLQE